MTGKNSNDEQSSLTKDEATTLELLGRGAKVLPRVDGWVIHLKGMSYGTGGQKTIDDLTERGFLQGNNVTEAGKEALESYYTQYPSERWKPSD